QWRGRRRLAGDPILFERRGRAGLITLNRPQVLNALDLAMLRPLRATLRDWAGDPEIGVVILRGAGERAFCAGGDVVAVRDRRGDAAFMDEVYRVEYEVDDLLHTFPR